MTEEQYERLQMAFLRGLAEADDIEDAQTLAAALDMHLKIFLDRFRKKKLATGRCSSSYTHVTGRCGTEEVSACIRELNGPDGPSNDLGRSKMKLYKQSTVRPAS